MSANALSGTQFNIERQMMALSGGTSDLDDRVRGIQRRTSNVFPASFASDYTNLQPNPSPAAAASQPQREEGEEEE